MTEQTNLSGALVTIKIVISYKPKYKTENVLTTHFVCHQGGSMPCHKASSLRMENYCSFQLKTMATDPKDQHRVTQHFLAVSLPDIARSNSKTATSSHLSFEIVLLFCLIVFLYQPQQLAPLLRGLGWRVHPPAYQDCPPLTANSCWLQVYSVSH